MNLKLFVGESVHLFYDFENYGILFSCSRFYQQIFTSVLVLVLIEKVHFCFLFLFLLPRSVIIYRNRSYLIFSDLVFVAPLNFENV